MISETTYLTVLLGLYALGAGLAIGAGTRPWRDKRRATIAAPTDSTTKFCRDCRWAFAEPKGLFGEARDWAFAKCLHPTSIRSAGTFLATGEHSPDNANYCSIVRDHGGKDQCGATAVHFAPRGSNGQVFQLAWRK